MRVQRVAKSNDRVTQGHMYQVHSDGKIIDDNGDPMRPHVDALGEYWIEVQIPASPPHLPTEDVPEWTKWTELELKQMERQIHCRPKTDHAADSMSYLMQGLSQFKNQEKKTMTTVENTVLINDRKADNFTTDEIVLLIKAEEEKIEALGKVLTVSKAIDKLKAKHEKVIVGLVEVIDARED